ncbi:MAG: DUF5009 domain-containing protein [Kiritimatiellae bacterium]|nr:DUF5009 domain-containing protein [Kiritimatiellia bacterium]
MEATKRILSIDALRGFDMMWIAGVDRFLIGAGAALNNEFGAAMAAQMRHVDWAGLHIIDLVFPTFVFLAGASWPFSLASQRAKGSTDRQVFWRIVKRFLILFALGLVYDNFFKFDFANCLYNSVLGRVGFGWAVAAATLLFCKRLRTVILVSVGIFAAYWIAGLAIPLAVNPPGVDPWMPREVAVGRIVDNWLLNGLSHVFGAGFLEVQRQNVFAAFGCISSAFLGMYSGLILGNGAWSPARKSGTLALFAVALGLGGGLALLTGCPCVKPSWNPTYILVSGSIATALLALFHWLIDVKGHVAWSFVFRVIGMNSITIYMFHRLFDLKYTSRRFLLGVSNMVPSEWSEPVIVAGAAVVGWLAMYWLYRKKIFIRV